MKITSTIAAAVAAWSASASAAPSLRFDQAVVHHRDLQNEICTVCDVCDELDDGCDLSELYSVACQLCDDNIGIPAQICDQCLLCEDADPLPTSCDLNGALDLGCAVCDIVGDGGGDDGGGGGDDGDGCFSDIASVQVRDIGSVSMKDLKVGDYVLTSSNKYEEVYAFAHFNPSRPATFLQIYSENTDSPLEATEEHLVFLQGKDDPVPAEGLKVGDVLRTSSSQTGSTITKIKSVERKGIYAPMTTGGTLVVDGVTASSYIFLEENKSFVSDHDLAQIALSPYRMLCKGVSSTYCDIRNYNEDGMPYYVQHGLEILRWVLSGNIVTRVAGFAVVLLFLGCCQLAELLFGAYAPLVAFLLVSFGASKLKSKKTKTL